MKTSTLIGRQEEAQILQDLLSSSEPEVLALYGRRRIGKTFLIRAFFDGLQDVIFFNVTGAKHGAMAEQIEHFMKEVDNVFYGGMRIERKKNWDETFSVLTNAFKTIAAHKKIVLFFDELPWMATRNARLLPAIDYYWNQYWSRDARVKLIICGSSASWIINKVINDKGGLHNRITRRIKLLPFTLSETKTFLARRGIKLNNQHILHVYMVTGGVPFYLTQLKKGLSAAQQIEHIAFSKQAPLLKEFDNLFEALFDNGELYADIVRLIGKHRYGVGKRKLLEEIGKHAIGQYGTKWLNDLEEAGFIQCFQSAFSKKKGHYYRIIDEYIAFYLQWVDPIKTTLQVSSLDTESCCVMQNMPEWRVWQGYAFEAVCYKHLSKIRKKLSMDPMAIAHTWRYVPRNKLQEDGAQIDLLFDRQDDCITLCEIKHSNKPFVIDKAYAKVLAQKKTVFKTQTRTKKHLFMILIAANGIKDNTYSNECIDGVVSLEDLFDE